VNKKHNLASKLTVKD